LAKELGIECCLGKTTGIIKYPRGFGCACAHRFHRSIVLGMPDYSRHPPYRAKTIRTEEPAIPVLSLHIAAIRLYLSSGMEGLFKEIE